MKEMEGLEGKLANIGGKQTKNGAEKTKSEEDISSVAKTGASSMKEEEKLNSEEKVEDKPEEVVDRAEVENSEESSEKMPEDQKSELSSGVTEEIEDIKINHSIKQAVKTGPDGEISVYPLGVKSIQNEHPLAPSSDQIEDVSFNLLS